MVFESILNPKLAEDKPWLTFIFGAVYSTIAIFLAVYIFPTRASLGFVFFTTLFFLPLFYRTMIYEERVDLDMNSNERSLLRHHLKAITFFIFLFIGLTLSFSLWYVVFSEISPMGINSETIFGYQLETINQINSGSTTGRSVHHVLSLFGVIFSNNIKVMIFCILFSFIFGAGAIFILSWNSSVIGAAIGKYIVTLASAGTAGMGWVYAKASTCGLLRYLIHGIPEILAYFIAGLAGGIISAAIINHDFGTRGFEKIMLDASYLIIIAIVVVLISGIIEVAITPLVMCKI